MLDKLGLSDERLAEIEDSVIQVHGPPPKDDEGKDMYTVRQWADKWLAGAIKDLVVQAKRQKIKNKRQEEDKAMMDEVNKNYRV